MVVKKKVAKRSGKTKTGNVPFFVQLPEKTVRLLRAERKRRGCKQWEIVDSAIKDKLAPEGYESEQEIVLDKLRLCNKKLSIVHRRQVELFEALGLFVKIWCNNTLEVPKEARAEARAQGEQRFSRYMQQLAEQIGKGSSLETNARKLREAS